MKPDQAPQPKDLEMIEAERICQEMREIAKRFPKPKWKKGDERPRFFGNNFSLLFLGLKQKKQKSRGEITGISGSAESRLREVEHSYGEQWKKFLEDNDGLISEIEEVLEQEEKYSELATRHVELLKLERSLGNIEFVDRISEEINLRGIAFDIANKLDPLLERASEAMRRCGINPEKFYR
jgi:hypothetical protein